MHSLQSAAVRAYVLVALFVAMVWVGPFASAQDRVQQWVSLDQPTIWHLWQNEQKPGDPASIGGPLALETVRQAVLISARDELSARTLDPAIGQPVQRDGVTALSIDMRLIFSAGTDLKLTHGEQLLLDTNIKTDWRAYRDMIEAVQMHEAASRGEYAQAWQKAGIKGAAHAWKDSAPVPAEIQAHLDVQSLISQFAAVRGLHALIEAEGESPERLWALCRAYANLGQESRWFIQPQYATFYARALLYAQRLAVKAPDHALTELAKAYTWLLSGYPKYAEAHLNKLDELKAAAAAAGEGEPAWASLAALLRACFEYDMPAIQAAMQGEGAEAHLAAMWNVKSIEFIDLAGLAFSTIEASVDVNPMSLRNAYPAYEVMGVSTGHRYTEALPNLFGAVTAHQFPQLADIPPAIAQAVGQLPEEPLSLDQAAQLGWTLVDQTAAGADDAEFSYAVLGTLIGEANALHVLYRAKFMRTQWGVDSSDYLRQSIGAIERHPFAPLIYTFVFRAKTVNEGMTQLMGMFEPTYINPYHVSTLVWHLPDSPRFANGKDSDWFWEKGYNMENQEGGNWLVNMRWKNGEHISERGDSARRMNGYDPHNPLRAALFLRYMDLPEPRLTRLSAQYGHHAVVADALADRSEKAGDLDAARSYADLAGELAPERRTLERLARIELLLGNEDTWLMVMKLALEQPDMGLDHATINRIIAHTYMNLGRYKEALPFAEASSRSWAQWALQTNVYCLAANGQYDQAEQYARAIDDRYNANTATALRIWTAQGNVEQAHAAIAARYRREMANDPVLLEVSLTILAIGSGDFEKAFEYVENSKSRNSRMLLMGLVLAHHLEQIDKRDQYVKELAEHPLIDGKRPRFAIFGELLNNYFQTGEYNQAQFQDWFAQHDPTIESGVDSYLGWMLMKNGDTEQGLEILLPLAKEPTLAMNIDRAVCRAFGVTEDQLQPTGFTPAHIVGPLP